MPYMVGLLFVVVLALGGVGLLYGSVSAPDALQTARLIAGAALISLGLLTLVLLAKNWLRWRKDCKLSDSVEMEVSRETR